MLELLNQLDDFSSDERIKVNKMGGEIKVVKKDGPGTLMQLSLVLGLPVDATGKHFEVEFDKHNL
ncbi:hypothetical protein Taro_057034, partial [Colocasia esculenta]|nr:hypothetical protein [Colocasia esculenta]